MKLLLYLFLLGRNVTIKQNEITLTTKLIVISFNYFCFLYFLWLKAWWSGLEENLNVLSKGRQPTT